MHNESMNVLLDINGLVNRGDQLMLATCYEQTRARLPRATICVGENVYREGIAWCRARGVLPLAPRRPGAKARFKEYAVRIFQTASRRRFRLYPSQIDLVLAAPGFHYGDAFENIYSDRMVEEENRKFRSFKKKKRRIVLLPQALGPFEKPLSHRLFEGVLACTDIVYARDKTSFNLVLKRFPEAKTRLRLGPDFTCLAEGTNPTVSFPHRSTVVVIPNVRMTTHAGESGESYVAFMVDVCKMLTERGEMVILLNHEGKEDEDIIRQLNRMCGERYPVLSGLSGLDCKSVIGNAKLVVSSRYHGVVSGLTQDIPTFCTGWSHKYGELLAEHGCPDNLLDVHNPEKAFRLLADALDHPKKYVSRPGYNDKLRNESSTMWDEIIHEAMEKQ